jgi:hypothetical protein
MAGHHLILGKLTDVITGQSLDDTLDERHRQRVAKLLLRQKGYEKGDILVRLPVTVKAGKRAARVPVDFLIRLGDMAGMLVRYGPGSLVTRHRPALALARLVAAHPVPVVVVTNGRDADILSGTDGRILSSGLDSIPARSELLERLQWYDFPKISAERLERESRIVYAYEVDGSCPCDDTICRLPEQKPE